MLRSIFVLTLILSATASAQEAFLEKKERKTFVTLTGGPASARIYKSGEETYKETTGAEASVVIRTEAGTGSSVSATIEGSVGKIGDTLIGTGGIQLVIVPSGEELGVALTLGRGSATPEIAHVSPIAGGLAIRGKYGTQILGQVSPITMHWDRTHEIPGGVGFSPALQLEIFQNFGDIFAIGASGEAGLLLPQDSEDSVFEPGDRSLSGPGTYLSAAALARLSIGYFTLDGRLIIENQDAKYVVEPAVGQPAGPSQESSKLSRVAAVTLGVRFY